MIKSRFLLIIIAVMPTFLFGQNWSQVGGGIQRTLPASQSYISSDYDGTNLYVAEQRSMFHQGDSTLSLSVWNGNFWTHGKLNLPNIAPPGIHTARVMKIYGGEVYFLIGRDLYKKVNNDIVPVQTSFLSNSYIQNMVVMDNKLMLFGNHLSATPGVNTQLVAYDGTTFTEYPEVPWLDYFNSISKVGGKLYVAGDLYSSNDVRVDSSVLAFNPTQNIWDMPMNFIQATGVPYRVQFPSLYNRNDTLVMADRGHFFEVYVDSLVHITNMNLQNKFALAGGIQFQGKLLFSRYGKALFGSINVWSQERLMIYDGQNLVDWNNSPQRVLNLVKKDSTSFYALQYDNEPFNGVNYNSLLEFTGSAYAFHLDLFHDINSNCSKSINEEYVNGIIGVNNTEVSTKNGKVSFYTDSLAFTIDSLWAPDIKFKNSAPTCSLPINVNLSTSSHYEVGIKPDSAASVDLSMSQVSTRLREGFPAMFSARLVNSGAQDVFNPVLHVSISPKVSNVVPSIAPTSVNNGEYTFQMSNFPVFADTTISFQFLVDTNSSPVLDSLQFATWVTNVASDIDTSDNLISAKYPRWSAFDPNDKRVNKESVYNVNEKLFYTIRFQNTGNDTAFNITIIDTINSTLNLQGASILQASHQYEVYKEGNVLTFHFPNIMLPDSGASYLGSQGFIKFSMDINQGMTVGDTVSNSAQIYFDFQKPVFTNTAKTAIIDVVSLEEYKNHRGSIEVFPNPANDRIVLRNNSAINVSASIRDVSGQLVKVVDLDEFSEASINVSHLSPGLYTVNSALGTIKILIQ